MVNEKQDLMGVDMHLDNNQAEIIQNLLANYSYAYRSDAEVNCERELVQTEKIGHYPYAPISPTEGLTNPVYDWTAKKWRSADTAEKDRYEDVYKEVKALREQNATSKTEMASLRESSVSANKGIAELGQQFNGFGIQVMDALKVLTDAVNGKTDSSANTSTTPDTSAKVDEAVDTTKEGDAE